MINKKLVARNFSRSSKTYDKYAQVQKHMGKKLLTYIENKPESILEIGCGTGYLSKILVDRYPNAKIDLCDISEEMLKLAEDRLGSKINRYICGDIEELDLTRKYDLIISNATFQWFNNIEKTLEKLNKSLNKDAVILFSTFGNETYKELTESFRRIDEGYSYSQDFHSRSYLDKLGRVVCEEFYIEEYKTLLDFLKSIKGVGATSAREDRKKITRSLLEKVEKQYRCLCGDKVEVTNHLLYVSVKKTV